MGFSVISVIEIIYFLSIRPYCATKRAANDEKFNQTRNYVSNFRVGLVGGNKQASHMSTIDHQSMFQVRPSSPFSICEEFQSKLISATRYIKAKASSVWNSILEIYKENDEGQMPSASIPPYPYLDWSAWRSSFFWFNKAKHFLLMIFFCLITISKRF